MRPFRRRIIPFASSSIRTLFALLLCACFMTLTFALSHAAVINVPQDHLTIQGAIDAATDGDEIIVSPSTYTERIDFKGKNIILRSTDPTSSTIVDTTIIDATIVDVRQERDAVTFAGTEASSCVLAGFTITNSSSYAVWGAQTQATIRHNRITSNRLGLRECDGLIEHNNITSNTGSGLNACDGLIQHNNITSNTTFEGGGLYRCRGLIQHNIILGNEAVEGGGLYVCHGTIQYNRIERNKGDRGAGLGICNGTIQYNDILFNSRRDIDYNRYPPNTGGGLYHCNGTIRNNVIMGNSMTSKRRASGGGLSSCDALIQNNLIWGNWVHSESDEAWGGGLTTCRGGIQNNTIYGNRSQSPVSARDGGLSYCGGLITNCIIWGNQANGSVDNLTEGSVRERPMFCCIEGEFFGDNITTTPGFVDPANGDFHLRSDSSCVDRGGVFYLMGSDLRDLDGNCRLAGGSVDIGCFEFGSSRDGDGDLLADKDEATSGGNPALPDTDGDGLIDGVEILRGTSPSVPDPPVGIVVPLQFAYIQQAIFLAFPGETITVSLGTYHENLYSVGRGFVLQGPGPYDRPVPPEETPILDGRNYLPVLQFTGGENEKCAVRGVTVRNGRKEENDAVAGIAGVGRYWSEYPRGAGVTIERNNITNNTGAGLVGCSGPIRSNSITSNTGSAISGCNGPIEDNWITSNSLGMYRCNGPVRRNQIYENAGHGFYLVSGDVSGNAIVRNGGYGMKKCDGLIEQNLVTHNGEAGLFECGKTLRDNQVSDNVGAGLEKCAGLIEQNVVTHNGGIGFVECGETIRDNRISENGAGGLENCIGLVENNLISGNSQFGVKNCNGQIRRNQVLHQKGFGLWGCNGSVERNFVAHGESSGLAECEGTIQNNVIYDNGGVFYGGGLYRCNGVIQNNTIYANSAEEAGGGLSDCTGVIKNCIIWGNSSKYSPQISSSSLPDYCCIQDWPFGPDWTLVGEGNITSPPGFSGDGDFHLPLGSPCIDAGAITPGLTEDFDGRIRPFDAIAEPRGDGSDFDIGAYEAVAATAVTIPWQLYR